MDIVAQLKTERDKAARQLNALDTAISALSGLNSTRATRGRRKNFCFTESTVGASTGPEGCFNRSQAPHLTSGTGSDQSGN